MDSAWFEAILKRHERDNQIARIVKYDVEPAVSKGQNYASYIERAKLTVMLGSGKTEVKSLIIKNDLSLLGSLESISKAEITIYRDILSLMDFMMQKYGDKQEKLWCDLIGYNPYNKIVFQDLTAEGYVLHDRKKGLDYSHCALVIRGLARFHAMSKVMIQRGLINAKSFWTCYVFTSKVYSKNIIKGGLKTLSESIKSSWPEEWKFLSEKVAANAEIALGKLKELGENLDDKFKVLNHGDCWTCNLMFKYSQNDGNPISVRFLDFQACHIQSFAWDFMHFLFSSGLAVDRRRNLKELVKVYHATFTATLKFYNYDGPIPTLVETQTEIERIMYYGFVIVSVLYPSTIADNSEAFYMDKLLLEGAQVFNPENTRAEKYIREVIEDYEYFLQNNII